MESSTDTAQKAVTHTSTALSFRCWGTRGSIPSPGPATAEFGGNTPCLEIIAGERRFIFDAGSGMRLLGLHLLQHSDPVDATIFLTHFHWDHIQGFPFFAPLYRPDSRLTIIGPSQGSDGEMDVETLFAGQMGPIYFPVPFQAISADCRFDHLNEGSWEEDGVRISSMRIRHPSYAVGYRLEFAGRSICFVPDNELMGETYPTAPDWREKLVEFLGGADLLIHDAMYTEEEYPSRVTWGHSTYRQTLDLAHEAGVGSLLFYHHDPERSDLELAGIVGQMRQIAESEGMTLEIGAASEGHSIVIQE